MKVINNVFQTVRRTYNYNMSVKHLEILLLFWNLVYSKKYIMKNYRRIL